jgi:hypothetical protein
MKKSCEELLTFFEVSSFAELIDRLDKLFQHEVKEFSLDGSSTLLHVSLETVGCSGHGATLSIENNSN